VLDVDQLAWTFNDSDLGDTFKLVEGIHLLVALPNANFAVPVNVILLEYTLLPIGIVTVCPFSILAVPVKSLGLVQVAELLKLPDPVLLVAVCACTLNESIKKDMNNKNFMPIFFYFSFLPESLNYLFVFVAL
jgi:hypothetical protein